MKILDQSFSCSKQPKLVTNCAKMSFLNCAFLPSNWTYLHCEKIGWTDMATVQFTILRSSIISSLLYSFLMESKYFSSSDPSSVSLIIFIAHLWTSSVFSCADLCNCIIVFSMFVYSNTLSSFLFGCFCVEQRFITSCLPDTCPQLFPCTFEIQV